MNNAEGVVGQALGITSIDFTALELFGAAARCSHMHFVDPLLVTSESQMIAALIQHHVDDMSDEFAVLSSANDFKDYVKSFFVGTVAAGVSYLTMIKGGYHWSDHFENVVGVGTKGRTPDFVFASVEAGVALTEAKGTRSSGKNSFDSVVEAGYLGQVEPHLGKSIGAIEASHGFCIGSWLTSTTKAEILVHQTETEPSDDKKVDHYSLGLVQRQNYATALSLVFGSSYGTQFRRGFVERVPLLLRFQWQGRHWLTRSPHREEFRSWPDDYDEPRWWYDRYQLYFAIDQGIAKKVLSYFRSSQASAVRGDMEIDPIPQDVIDQARGSRGGLEGAIFPDGLAVMGAQFRPENPRLVRWDLEEGQFSFV